MSEKKHPATAKKLREAHKRGEVAYSREFTSLAVFIVLFLTLWLGANYLLEHVITIVERGIDAVAPSRSLSAESWLPQVTPMFTDVISIVLPLAVLGLCCALLVGVIQTRGVFSAEPITPKFERINPAEGLKRIFSMRQLFELGKTLVKMTLLLGVLGYLIILSLDRLAHLVYAPAAELLAIAANQALHLMAWAIIIYAVGASLDYAHQRYEFMKRQKMSVEELQRERREESGDPIIRATRRAIARDSAFGLMVNRVETANLVIANPTHVCVALQYVAGQTALPRVVAKGVDAMALRIRAAAERAGVPVLEDAPLARRVFSEVALDDYIDAELIDVIAAAFRWARKVDRRVSQSGSRSPR